MAGLDPNIDWAGVLERSRLLEGARASNGNIIVIGPNGERSNVGTGDSAIQAANALIAQGYRPATAADLGGTDATGTRPAAGPGARQPTQNITSTGSTGGAPVRPNRVDFATRARAMFGFLPDVLLDVFVNAYDENNGDTELAKTVMRQHTAYDQYYAGNRRGDGTVRLDEAEYVSTVEGHNRRRGLYGMTPLSPELQRRLIEADVSPDEYGSRLAKTYVQLASNIEAVRQDYAERWGATNLSDAALMESATDPGVNPLEAERRIRTSAIGGEAKVRGFSLATAEAERMESLGLDQKAARALYGQAQSELPKLNEMVGRFNDPDDPLTIEDFADAVVLTDADQAARIGRLYGQQRSLFSTQDLFTRDQGGGLTGLLDR